MSVITRVIKDSRGVYFQIDENTFIPFEYSGMEDIASSYKAIEDRPHCWCTMTHAEVSREISPVTMEDITLELEEFIDNNP